MIAELAAFNVAFGVVKSAISNGKDIVDCAKHIGDMIGAQEQLQARGNRKKNSMWSALAGKDTNDFEEFMALEKIKAQRKELMQALQLYGRPGMKDDFLKFEVEARKQRRADAIAAEQRKQTILEWMVGIITFIIMLLGLAAGMYFVGKAQGKW